jgi:type VI secretion system secreted protein Hcp
MALPVYIEVEGTKQGKFEGGSKRKGREKMIEGTAVEHQVMIPTDKLSGRATGNRIHGAFTFTKEIDKSSPQLQNALVTGEQIKSMIAHFWHITPEGKEVEFYKIVLSEAQVTAVKTLLPNVNDPELEHEKAQEHVALRYTTIEWTFLDGNVMATDSWLVPAGA